MCAGGCWTSWRSSPLSPLPLGPQPEQMSKGRKPFNRQVLELGFVHVLQTPGYYTFIWLFMVIASAIIIGVVFYYHW